MSFNLEQQILTNTLYLKLGTLESQIMINGDLNEFLDLMKRGMELVFVYKGQKFFIQGYYDFKNETSTLCLDRWEPPLQGDVWVGTSVKDKYCDIDEFCNAKIFDGKSFWEIEPEVEWVDC